MKNLPCFNLFTLFLFATLSVSAQPLTLPLFQINNLTYAGAFRLPADEFGTSSLNFSEGPFVIDSWHNSIFIVGHNHHQQIAEFSMPALSMGENLSDLNMAGTAIQPFTSVLNRANEGNPQAIDRIGGLCLLASNGDTSLLINGYEYYDAPGDNTHTTIKALNPYNLASSEIVGYYQFEGGAGHTSGWISQIPIEWQMVLGGTHLTGQSSGIPIISRASVGPSAFAFSPDDIPSDPSSESDIPTEMLLDFSLTHPLHNDLENSSLDNDLWTHLSKASFGMIVPGTRTYLTIGSTGGHNSGVCYKCTQDNGNLCGGYCPPVSSDVSQYYWLWDLADLVKVKNGEMMSYDVRPYDYGPLDTPFQNGGSDIGGGSFDPVSGNLYLSIQKGDSDQGPYSTPPVIVAYTFASTALPVTLLSFQGNYEKGNTHFLWKTSQEQNVGSYVIQRMQGEEFMDVKRIKSQGNNTAGFEYESVLVGFNSSAYYRLKIEDLDNAVSYSEVIYINVGNASSETQVYPNPFYDQLTISFKYKKTSELTLEIYDPLGRKVFTKQKLNLEQFQEVLNLSSLLKGIYCLRIMDSGRIIESKMIIKE